jgi:ribosomal protein S27E
MECPEPQAVDPAEMAALQAAIEAGKFVFTCPRCNETSWRLLIPKHARLGITCMGCGVIAVPAWKCAEVLALATPGEALAAPGDCSGGFAAPEEEEKNAR